MRIAITGAHGFLGWHLSCRIKATGVGEPVRLGRAETADPQRLATALAGVDAVVHAAGVNRAADDEAVEQGNVEVGSVLAEALGALDRPVDVVYANSVQADLDNAYGRGKAEAGRRVAAAVARTGGRYADVLLPNLFGEHGRPAYNSFVATFAHEVAADRLPEVTVDREVPLMHVQDAAAHLLAALGTDGEHRPAGEPRLVSDVLASLRTMHGLYRQRGEVPPLASDFDVRLFNTYRAALFPTMWPLAPTVHEDERGRLFEGVRAHGGTGQAFVSTTRPGRERGNHYHLHKVERFLVVSGEAEIALRRLFHDDVVTFRLSGTRPAFVDMPTLWAHSIRNVGDDELVTVFWADQLLDPENPDQYPEPVVVTEEDAP